MVKNNKLFKKWLFRLALISLAAAAVAVIFLLASPKAAVKPSLLVSEIQSAQALNMMGIRAEIPSEDFDNICELVSSAKNVTEYTAPTNETPDYGIYITTKNNSIVAISELSGDMLFQRDGRSWVIDDPDLESFVHDVCAVDAEEPYDPHNAAAPAVFANIPGGFIINEAGATDAEVSAIYEAEKAGFNNGFDIEYAARQGIHLYIYARQDWHGGALLLAGLSPMGELAPELYYINNSGVVTRTNGSDVWSINYTHYAGETIVFGESFAWDNGPLATSEVTAEFLDGNTVTVPMEYSPNGEMDISCGFICVSPSITWLKSLKITKDGKTVADDYSGPFTFSPANEPWYGEAESIRNRTRYVCTSDSMPANQIYVTDFFGGYPSLTFETPYAGESIVTHSLTYWPYCHAHEGVSPDIWHSNNGLHEMADVIAGSQIAAVVMSVTDNYDDRQKLADLCVSKAYWADLSVDDDERCIREGELVCPRKKGYYILILLTDYGYFSQTMRVV